jgi:hypothetical protein
MKQDRVLFAIEPLLFFAIAAVFVCATASPLKAQGKQQDLTLREHQMSALEREKTRKREPKEILAEVNEDMGRLKILNEEISAQAVATDQQPNYKSILDNVTEVKKRATRLATDLALPQEDKEEKRVVGKDAEKGALQPALLELNKLLDGFLNNPVFSDTGAVDLQLAAKARRDLDDIIVLSDKLRKGADKRSKAGGKAP